MWNVKWTMPLVFVAGLTVAVAAWPMARVVAQEKGGAEVTGPYEYVDDWPLPVHNDGWTWGSIPAVWAESRRSRPRVHAR